MRVTAQDEFTGFVRQHFRSVWALELLLLMRRELDRAWTVDELVDELRASPPLVRNCLASLQRSGLLIAESATHYRYGPAGAFLPNMCDEIDRLYRERPVALINLISAPDDRLQQLADAFKFRGDAS